MLAELIAEADAQLWAGNAAAALGLLDEAQGLDATPVDRYSLGEAYLRASRCTRGWDLYDLHPSRPVDRLPGVQRWDGQPCGLLILVAEQGFGDALQFLRFVPRVVGRAQEVVLAVHDELLSTVVNSPLLAGLQIVGKSVARAKQWPTDARWERLMSLPVRIDGFEAEAVGAYLRVDAISDRCKLPRISDVPTVGVAWRSTPRRGFPNRSIPSRLMRKLGANGAVRLVALHRDRDIKSLPLGVESARINDFADTAQVIAQCDFVVTADTVTAHLAPALGVPTFIGLRNRPDWRWGAPTAPVPWYSRAELLFQDESSDWRRVVEVAAHRISDGSAPAPKRLRGELN